jgi:hypothetical protein
VIIKARKKKRSDPSMLTAAIKKAAEEHERSTKRVEDQLEKIIDQMRNSDAPDEEEEIDLDR